jgi:hypothetical protein
LLLPFTTFELLEAAIQANFTAAGLPRIRLLRDTINTQQSAAASGLSGGMVALVVLLVIVLVIVSLFILYKNRKQEKGPSIDAYMNNTEYASTARANASQASSAYGNSVDGLGNPMYFATNQNASTYSTNAVYLDTSSPASRGLDVSAPYYSQIPDGSSYEHKRMMSPGLDVSAPYYASTQILSSTPGDYMDVSGRPLASVQQQDSTGVEYNYSIPMVNEGGMEPSYVEMDIHSAPVYDATGVTTKTAPFARQVSVKQRLDDGGELDYAIPMVDDDHDYVTPATAETEYMDVSTMKKGPPVPVRESSVKSLSAFGRQVSVKQRLDDGGELDYAIPFDEEYDI